ncbi:MAG: amino acid adenylation domain-containing protein [Arenicella sp.]|jgi:amino acid adenylation domain-containing protein/non-ribosomal peptide synthase protein (TIGR01720 family)
METIHDYLAAHAHSKKDNEAFTFIEDNGEKSLICFADLHRRAQSIAQYLVTEFEPGTKVVLLFPQGLEYIQAFLGCLYAGVVAVPLYPPSSEKHAGRVLTVIDDCKAKLVLTTNALKSKLEAALSPLPVVGFEQLIEPAPVSLETPPTADQIAFLQYTSGSTGSPKGVMVSHGNIIANLKLLEEATSCSQEDVFCNWLPLFHDLGLVNTLLLPIYLGSHSILMSPARFIKRPLVWLKAITEYQASICGAPNFAFDHCVERIPPHKLAGIDLSSWRIAFNAAEPVDADTMLRFSDRFSRVGFKESALFPAYGMAEATVFITGGSHSKSYLAQPFSSDALQRGQAESSEGSDSEQILVAHGRVQTDHHLKIVSPETVTELLDGQIGEIWFAGPSLAQGYWNDAEKTTAAFGAQLKDDPNKYLRTGDLGFIHQGELYISGRIKDVLIIKGRNYYPQDFEKLAYNACAGLKQNGAAAVDVNGKAVLLLEVSRSMQKEFDYKLACEIIQAAIFEHFEVILEDIVFLRAARLNRTSSGKIQRSLIKSRYLSEDLNCLYSLVKGQSAEDIPLQTEQAVVSVSKLEAELCALWQEVFGLDHIGVEENFLNLGGHSLLATSLISQIQKKWHVEISIRSFFTANTVRKLAKVIENTSTHQPLEILPVAVSDPLLTSFAQERLWLVNLIETDQAQYNLSFSLKLYGELNETFLLKAFKTILARHQALRTTYKEEDGQVFQKIQESFQFDIPVINLVELTTIGQEQRVAELTQEEAGRLFDLSQDLMLRVKLLKLNPQSHILLITVHHIAADGWSLGVLTKELNALYSAYAHGLENPLAPLNIQYTDYVYWQRDRLKENVLQNHLDYWKGQLSNLPVIHSLPLDHPRPAVQTFKGASVYHTLSEDLQEGLHSLARKNDATLFMLLNAAFASFLSRYTGESDIVIGSPVANREQAELAPLIGFFINTLVFRSDLSADPTFLELLEQSKERIFAAQEHQQTPFEKLVDELQPERSLSHSPLFQVMLSFQNQEIESLNLPGLEVKRLQPTNTVAQYDLTLIVHERDNSLDMEWQYATDLFSQSTIERMIGHFEVLLQGIIKSPQKQISQLPLLNKEQSTQLLHSWNDTASDYPQDKCIHELFEEQVERNPDAVATVFNKEELSYDELNQRANQLAHYLVSQGVTPDSLVGICVERSLDMLVGVLAIMKSGGAYLPLDPSYPKARLEYMIKDSGVQWVITQKHLAEQCSVDQVICLDDESLRDELTQLGPSNLNKNSLGLTPNHLAYLIYTSGSTGKPKGVMLEHHNLTNFLSAMQVEPGMTKEDRLLAVTSLSFDIHVLELYLPLIAGGRVVIASSEDVLSPDNLEQLIDDHRVTSMQATPATWKMLVNNDWKPQHTLKVLCGGEALSRGLKDELLRRDAIELWNMYGPTETAVWSAIRRIEDVVSLGSPIANTQFYVLDPHLNPVPVGVAAELYIGGEGVARGYLNQPKLTDQQFILNPFSNAQNARLYKTGDLVRWLPDGTLEYLRRIDLQVKVRGHRIELEEIEAGLRQHPDVKEAVVHVWTEGETSNLVAYVTGVTLEIEKDIQQKLTDFLESFLPGYMVPSAYLCLENIPLTPNGKINRNALPAPKPICEYDYIPPQTDTEKNLCQIWQQLLNIEVKEEQWISVTSNFFHLGGHSLLAARLVSQVRKQWNVEVPIRMLFTEQTVRKFAKVVDHASISQIPKIVPVSTSGLIPLSFAQQRLWLIDQIEQGSTQYNLSQAFQFSGKLDVAAMNSAFQSIVERHPVLRTTFQTTEAGEAIQVVCPNWDFSISVLDLAGTTEEEQEQAALRYLEEEASQPFDLSTDLLIRAKLLKFHQHAHALLVTMHHIAVDGWSVGIIFDEFNRLYRSPQLSLPSLEIQYADYAYWQNNWLQGDVLEHHLQFWKDRLHDLPEVHNLALDRPRNTIQNYEGSHYHQILSADIQEGLNNLARTYDATLFIVLQTAFAILLARHSNKGESGSDSQNIVIGTPVANREQAELSPLVGFFVNSLILRTNLSGNPCFDSLLLSNKDYLLDAYEHAQVPFEKLVDTLKQERNLSHSPLFQVKLALQNNQQGKFDLPGLSYKRIEQSQSVALHDLSVDIFEVNENGNPEGLTLDWEYATALFDASTIERMAKHFEVLLKGIIEKPQARISELPFLTTAEVEQLLAWSKWSSTGNDSTAVSLPARKSTSVLDLFEEQVVNNPNNIAVMFNESTHCNERLTYKDLNAKANQVAHYLIDQGVKPDTLVGLCVERSLEMIIGIWGILKAGGAYVPIDSDYPEKHIEHILEDSGVEIVLTSSELLSELPFDELQILPLDDEMWEGFLGSYSLENTDRQILGVSLNNLAYVIYTSGSTGLPKGVTVEHASLVQSTLSRFDVYQESPSSFALFSSFAFDSSIVGIFWTLVSGGKLCILDIKQGVDLAQFQSLMIEEHVSHFLTLPSVYQAMLSSDLQPASSLKTIIVAGEACGQNLVEQHQSHEQWKNYRLFNEYGPTEACVWSSYYDCTHHTGEAIPIGTTVPHAELFVLDRELQLCPLGVTGELYIGGESLARGYLNAPELTNQKFIPSPFHEGQRIYKTGDLVRCLPSQDDLPGNLEFLGRLDNQIKIRGFRIELGEIEAEITKHEYVSEAVVLAKTTDPSQKSKQLVAYVVTNKNNSDEEFNESIFRESLQSHLVKSLLNHKVPSVFVILQALPLTPNGKVDREVLQAKEVSSQLTHQYVAPKTDMEKQLCEIWQNLLKVNKVGITENFFAIGGDSILSIQAVARAAKVGLVFTTRQVFECQTIEKLAPEVSLELKVIAPQISISGEQILIPIQREFVSTDLVDQHHYNQSVLLTLPKDFSLDALQQIVLALYQRHDVLRLSASGDKATYIQLTDQHVNRAIECTDLSHLHGAAWESALEELGTVAKSGLSLINGDVFRALLFEGKADQRRLLLTLHHMIVDGVSWRILLEDMAMAFEQWRLQETISLPLKTSSFQQWGQYLLEYSNSEAFQSERDYWLAQAIEQANGLPVDHSSVDDNRIIVSKTISFKLTVAKTQALLNDCASVYRTQINDLLLSALYLALQQWTSQTVFRVDLESHGRESLTEALDLTQTMGWFTSVFPVTLGLDTVSSISDVIKTVKEQLRRVPHNGIGFGLFQKMIQDDADRATFGQAMGCTSEILFNYLGQFDQVVNKDSAFQEAFEPVGEDVSLQRQRSHMLELNGMVAGGQLGFSLRYNGLQYAQDTMGSLAQGIESALYQIIEHCQSKGAGGVTPSDFPISHVNQTQLDEWYQTYPNFEKLYPTTGMQQGLLFHSGLDNSAYLTQLSIDIEGPLDFIAMKQAWNEVVRRHDVFRTLFSDDHTHQLVLSEVTLPFTELDLSEYNESEQQQRLAQFLKEDRAKGFDLKQVPLMRITLIAFSQQRYCLIWSNHHALSDGWSLPLVLKEVLSLYKEASLSSTDRASTGQPCVSQLSSVLPKTQPYENYIAWLGQQDDEKARSYWKDMLARVETPTQINVDRIVDGQSRGARKQSLTLTQEKGAQLLSLAKHHQVTLNTLIQAAWAYLLHRYCGEEQVVFGETISGRPPEINGVEDMVGLFINSLPVVVNIELEQEIGTWLRAMQQASIDRVEHAFLPLSEIQNLSPVSNSGGRERTLFDTLVVFENYPVDQEIEKIIAGSEFSVTDIKNEEQTNYALTLMVLPESTDLHGKLSFELGYRAERYEEGTITRILEQLELILTGLLDHSHKTVGELSILTAEEEHRLLVGWNETASDFPHDKCIHELFEEQVERTPDAVATVFNKEALSYAELNQRANQLARYLVSQGVTPDSLVGICVERSLDMLVGVLAIMKSGGAYLPLDPSYPKARLEYMLTDSGVQWVITQESLAEQCLVEQPICLNDESLVNELVLLDRSNLNKDRLGLSSNHLAYVIYTSGSTGKPKGVMLEHHNLTNFLSSMLVEPGMSSDDTLLAVTSLSFDIHALELYLPLIVGGRVVIASSENALSADELGSLIEGHRVTIMQATPATWKMLVSDDWEPQRKLKVLCGGEALSRGLKDELLKRDAIELWNMYGPTETAVWSATQRIEDVVSLGTPIANTQFYVLDTHLNPVPLGVAGELHIGGEGVARGYLNQPDLTAEKFIQNPFADHNDNRIYKTGDLVRWLSDGTLEYIARIDAQVKVRGFRIELGEIESRLDEYPDIKDSVVITQGKESNKQLIAFYLSRDKEDDNGEVNNNSIKPLDEDLKAHLRQTLPEYMLPTAFVSLETIPLTPNGKVDRRALEHMDVSLKPRRAYLAPCNATEKQLVAIWAEVLDVEPEKIGINDSFFELGGHSVLVTQITAKVRDQLGIDLPIKALFEQDNIADLAQLIAESERSSVPAILPVDRVELNANAGHELPLSFIQERLWFIDQLVPNDPSYNIPGAVAFSGELDIDHLEQAFNLIIARHENLRTLFPSQKGQAQQCILDFLDFKLERIDLSHYKSHGTRHKKAQKLCQLEAATPFDLAKGPLIRGQIITLAAQEHILMLTMHHIITDELSVGILIKELGLIMDCLQKGQSPDLPPLPIQYLDYSIWQRKLLEEDGLLQQQLIYWQEKLAGVPESLNLMTDYPRPRIQDSSGATSKVFRLDTKLTSKLKGLAKQQGCTLFMTLLAAFKVLLYRYTSQEDICLGSPIANRQYEETKNLIGMFVNTIALRSQVGGETSFNALLTQVKTTCLEAYEHQDTPFEKIVDLVQPERNTSISAIFQIMFILHNDQMESLEQHIQSYPLEYNFSRFDQIIHLTETPEGLEGFIGYRTALYKPETIEQMAKHFIALCRAITATPSAKVCDLKFIDNVEKQQLLIDYNRTQADYPKDKCIHQLFVEQVAVNPDKTALVQVGSSGLVGETESKLLSYQQLYEKSYELALYLQSLGVKPDSLVGLCVGRSMEMMVGILGILQAGGAYVPLDPDYPDGRLAYMLEDSQATIVLTLDQFKDKLKALVTQNTKIIVLDQQDGFTPDFTTNLKSKEFKLRNEVKPDNLAYVMYTSGSTGQPKGVMIEHRMVVDYCYSVFKKMDLHRCESFAAVSTFSSDLGNIALYVPIMFSKTIYLFSNYYVNHPIRLKDYFDNHPIDCMKITPSHFEMFKISDSEIVSAEKVLIFAGEPLTKKIVDTVNTLKPDCNVFNNYGPTETTISKLSTSELISDDISSIYLGRPLSNTQVYILDHYNQPQPVGVPGELHIAGDGVARGYLNRPELTEEKFIPNPFNTGARMYKSGDLARWLADGNIEYLGRIDTQIKIRGFRIELGEIEARLNQYPEIKDSVVVAQGQETSKKLIAFYTTENAVEGCCPGKNDAINESLREHLLQTLPEYMLPMLFVSLEAIPLTPNGKVDRRALERTDVSFESNQTYLAPRNDMERHLVVIWADILNLEPGKIGVNDNFFELGGHSLLAVSLVSKIDSEVGLDLPLYALFDLPTISGTAEVLSVAQYQDEELWDEDDIDQIEFEEGTL